MGHRLISADSHVVEAPDLWKRRMDAAYRASPTKARATAAKIPCVKERQEPDVESNIPGTRQ